MEDYTPVKIAYDTAEPIFNLNENLCPLIFVHGFGHSKEVWNDIPQIAADETNRKVYVIDLRNIGDSQWSEEMDDEVMVQDLRHFMNLRKIKRAGIIAHSLGASVCQIFAMESPERVEFLIVEDQFISKTAKLGGQKEMGLSFYHHWVNAIRNIPPYLNKREAISYAVDFLYNQIPQDKHNLLSDKEKLCKCDFNLKQNDDGTYDVKDNVEVLLKVARNFEGFRPLEGTYYGPTYFIIGTASWCKVYEFTDEILQTYPNAELFYVEGATHNVHIDAPEEFTNIILKCILKHQKM